MDQKEKYNYKIHTSKYLSNLAGGKIKEVDWTHYVSVHNPKIHSGYTLGDLARGFMDTFKSSQNTNQEPDFLAQKNELADDRVDLTIAEVEAREQIRFDNLQRLYDDILRIDNLKLKLSHPDDYLPDKTQIDLFKLEIQAREMVRRELKDAAKDLGFVNKDLRESLLESKAQHQKTAFMSSGLEAELDSEPTDITPPYQPWGGLY